MKGNVLSKSRKLNRNNPDCNILWPGLFIYANKYQKGIFYTAKMVTSAYRKEPKGTWLKNIQAWRKLEK